MKAALLVSYAYFDSFAKKRAETSFRDYVLDSGAFSAMNSGTTIDVREYTAFCRDLADDPQLTEVFALDVIGDAKASMKNVRYMWKQGVEAIPTFHHGADRRYLVSAAKDFPKIALGGLAGKLANNHGQRLSKTEKYRWIAQVWERLWPKRVHCFGCTDETLLEAFPFESVDSTSWKIQPERYGLWKEFGRVRIKGDPQRRAMFNQISYGLRVEKRIRGRWRRLAAANGLKPFVYRFVWPGQAWYLEPFQQEVKS